MSKRLARKLIDSKTKIQPKHIGLITGWLDKLRDDNYRNIFHYDIDPLYMVGRGYYYTFYRDCLLVYRIQNYKGRYPELRMNFTPIHKSRNIEIEKQVNKEIRSLGIRTRYTCNEEAEFYVGNEYNIKDFCAGELCKYPGDFIYDKISQLDIEGSKKAQLRNFINRLEKDEHITYEFLTADKWTKNHEKMLKQINKEWIGTKDTVDETDTFQISFFINRFKYFKYSDYYRNKNAYVLIIYYDGKPVQFSISYYTGAGNILQPDRKGTLSRMPGMQQMSRVVHYLEIKHWAEQLPEYEQLFFNFGSAGMDKGLHIAKERMKPYKVLLQNTEDWQLTHTLNPVLKDFIQNDFIRPKLSLRNQNKITKL